MPTQVNGTTGVDKVQDGVVVTADLADLAVTPAKTELGALPSMVRLTTANGYGSVSTLIRRFLNTVINQGSDITYLDSPTLGSVFTINKNGVYAIAYLSQFNIANTAGAITLNSSNLAAQPAVASEILAAAQSSVVHTINCANWTGYLPAGAIIRPHNSSASAQGNNTLYDSFTIVRVA